MIIDIVSDLHGTKPKLEGGDLLILAGDYTQNDKINAWDDFFKWLEQQNYRKKIAIAGNHDNWCKTWAVSGTFTDDEYEQMYPGEKRTLDYLCDSGTEFEGLKIWGSPWTAWFEGLNPHCAAFTLKNDKLLGEKWALIPDDTDILITHSPPYGILDEAMGSHNYQSVGSKTLLGKVAQIKPKLHIFGHIHEAYGQYEFDGVKFINASIMDVNYKPSNKPVRIEL